MPHPMHARPCMTKSSLSLIHELRVSRRSIELVACACTFALFTPAHLRAQEPDAAAEAAVTATARTLAIEGVKLAQSERCPEAIEKLERAEKLHHAAIVLTRLGECYIRTGRLLAGVESLRAVLREALPANPSPALHQAYVDAQAGLEATVPKLARLTVHVEGPPPGSSLQLTVDGRHLPQEVLDAAQPCDPTEHVVQVSADGYLAATRSIHLSEAEEQTVVMTLTAAPPAVPREPAPALTVLSVPPSHSSEPKLPLLATTSERPSTSHWPAYVAIGLGAAGLGVGVGFGIAAMNNKASLDERCPDGACPAGSSALIDTGRTNALVSTVGYAVAGGGAVLGLLLYWLAGPAKPEDSQRRVRADRHGVSLAF